MSQLSKRYNNEINSTSTSLSFKGYGYFYFPSVDFKELNIPENARAVEVKVAKFEMIWKYGISSIYSYREEEFGLPFEISGDDLMNLNKILAKKESSSFTFTGERWEIVSWGASNKFKFDFGFGDNHWTKELTNDMGGMSQSLINVKVKINMEYVYRV